MLSHRTNLSTCICNSHLLQAYMVSGSERPDDVTNLTSLPLRGISSQAQLPRNCSKGGKICRRDTTTPRPICTEIVAWLNLSSKTLCRREMSSHGRVCVSNITLCKVYKIPHCGRGYAATARIRAAPIGQVLHYPAWRMNSSEPCLLR